MLLAAVADVTLSFCVLWLNKIGIIVTSHGIDKKEARKLYKTYDVNYFFNNGDINKFFL